jgi:uncharacterized membrane protein YfcA
MPATEVNLPPPAIPIEENPTRAKSNRYFSWWLVVFALAWGVVFFTAFTDPLDLLAHNWPFFFIGFLGAVIGNSTAVGGGLIFIPIFIFLYQFPAVAALKIAIGSQAFGMTSGAISWLRRGAIPFKALWVSIPFLLAGSLFSTLVIRPNALLVKGFFGPASIFIGMVMISLLNRHGQEQEIPRHAYLPLILVSLVGGIITGWIAIGVGEVVAAFLVVMYSLHIERGIGLGVVLLSISSITLVILYQYFLDGIPWEVVMFTGFGCVFGGRLGPYVSQWIGPRNLKKFFATVAISDGTLFIVQFFLWLFGKH